MLSLVYADLVGQLKSQKLVLVGGPYVDSSASYSYNSFFFPRVHFCTEVSFMIMVNCIARTAQSFT